MKIMFTNLVLLLFALGLVLGLPSHRRSVEELRGKLNKDDGTESLGIYHGKKSSIKKHPYIASFVVLDEPAGVGTIVSESWVVANPESVNYYNMSLITVVVGSDNGYDGIKYQPKQVVVHPKYVEHSLDYAYACLKVVGKFKWSPKVQPLPLATVKPAGNTQMTVAGFGGTRFGSHESPVLMEGTMTWLPDDTCKKYVEKYEFTMTERVACAFNKGSTTLCDGDWGDAFVYNGTFCGMMSSAGDPFDFCTKKADPIFMSNIAPMASWIKKITGAS